MGKSHPIAESLAGVALIRPDLCQLLDSSIFVCLFLRQGFSVALVPVLEFALHTRLPSNSGRFTCLPSAVIKYMYHCCLANPSIFIEQVLVGSIGAQPHCCHLLAPQSQVMCSVQFQVLDSVDSNRDPAEGWFLSSML